MWGFSQWLHFDSSIRLGAFALALVMAGLLWYRYHRSSGTVDDDSQKGKYLLIAAFIAVIFLAAFYLLRARIHFLGDGYALITNLASDNPIIKTRNLGETLIRQVVYSVLSGDNQQRALRSYQYVSYAGGLVFFVTVIAAARVLFEKTSERLMFVLGLASGGYMLLFFGYAEHYSLFVPSVVLFCLLGVMIAVGRLNRWWILLPLALTIFLHVFGFILIPAAIYILIADTPVSRAWLNLARWAKCAIVAAGIAVAAVVFFYFFNSSYSFRFSFVPLISDRFTVDGYTLLSIDHLLDNISLIFLLFPGLLLALGAAFREAGRQQLRLREFVFLIVVILSTLGATFVIASGLGMARDWDLFSFGGVPLVITGFLLMLRLRRHVSGTILAVTLAILLGFFSLIPRVVGQAVPSIGLDQVYQYAMLDPHKSLYVLRQLDQYYRDRGIPERSPLLNFDYRKQYPEYGLVLSGIQLRMQGQSLRAVPEFRKAIEKNPSFAPAYANLGSCYLELDQVDSALTYLHIACGMRPHEVETLTDLGRAFLRKGEAELGRQYLIRALDFDDQFLPASLALLELHRVEGAERQYYELLLDIARSDQAPASVYKQAGDYYLARQSIDSAAAAYRRALDRGLDPAELNGVMQDYPELAPLIQ